MTDDRDPPFRQRRREADDRARRDNLERDAPNVVAFQARERTPPPPKPREPWRPTALICWAAILAMLVVYYGLTRFVFVG